MSNLAPPLERALRAYRTMHHVPSKQDHFTKKPRPRTVRLLRAAEVDALVGRYEAGATVYQLAAEFRISRGTVSNHLHARGIRLRLTPMTKSETQTAIALYREGLTMAEVADQVGRSASLISLTVKRAGMTARDSHGRPRT